MEYNPISVTDLNKYIKNKVDNDEYLNNVLVKGEISNFKHHYTGHMYLALLQLLRYIAFLLFFLSYCLEKNCYATILFFKLFS